MICDLIFSKQPQCTLCSRMNWNDFFFGTQIMRHYSRGLSNRYNFNCFKEKLKNCVPEICLCRAFKRKSKNDVFYLIQKKKSKTKVHNYKLIWIPPSKSTIYGKLLFGSLTSFFNKDDNNLIMITTITKDDNDNNSSLDSEEKSLLDIMSDILLNMIMAPEKRVKWALFF